MMVATTSALVGFVTVKAGILPEPLAARPIEGALFTQVNVPPDGLLVKFTAAVCEPGQRAWFGTAATVTVGFTVMKR